ncbi:MAG: Ig-like domain-containing protein [Bacteroidota bacterium]|jgi:hypothetical protein
MKQYFIYQILIYPVIAIFLVACANQQPPEGGPIDRTTPEIVSTYPDSSTMRNFSDNKIQLEFDRYVNERSVEEAIFISPYIGTLEFNWSGKELEITFSEKLRHNTTYVMNIGTDVEDLNKNRMTHAFTLAFSTGKEIDRGAIEGRVYPRNNGDAISGIMIFAYRLDGLNPDTLNPIIVKPDFITQTGKNGDFFLHHIPFGSYRIFGVRDEYRNLVYDREIDEYGVPSGIINITHSDSLKTGVLMKLAKEDTTGPRLVKVMAMNRNYILAGFSESINPASITLSSFSAIDTVDQKPLELLIVYPSPADLTSFFIVTQKQDSGREYRLSVHGITDSVGNKINPLANTLLFRSSLQSDTLGPRIVSVSIKDSAQAIDLQPVLTMTFSDALSKSDSLNWLNLFDNNKQLVLVEKKWISDVVISLRPEKQLMSRMWYTLRAELREVHDWAGRVCRDSTKSWRFETLDIEDLSSVEGIVIDKNKIDTAGHLYITAVQIGEKNPKQYIAAADATGNFLFPQIAEGRYVFQSFRDRNNNGKYDSGRPFPFIYSERFSSYSDTLKVRARWPLEGVKIEMK